MRLDGRHKQGAVDRAIAKNLSTKALRQPGLMPGRYWVIGKKDSNKAWRIGVQHHDAGQILAAVARQLGYHCHLRKALSTL